MEVATARIASSRETCGLTYALNGLPSLTPVTTQSCSLVTTSKAGSPGIGVPTTDASCATMAYVVQTMVKGRFVPPVCARLKLNVIVASAFFVEAMAMLSTTTFA